MAAGSENHQKTFRCPLPAALAARRSSIPSTKRHGLLVLSKPGSLTMVNILDAIGNGHWDSHWNSWFSHEQWWFFHSYVTVYQRVVGNGEMICKNYWEPSQQPPVLTQHHWEELCLKMGYTLQKAILIEVMQPKQIQIGTGDCRSMKQCLVKYRWTQRLRVALHCHKTVSTGLQANLWVFSRGVSLAFLQISLK